jgi:hypothetical protein
VLELSARFTTFAPEGSRDDVRELGEYETHQFLEDIGAAATVIEMREGANVAGDHHPFFVDLQIGFWDELR